MTWSELAGSMVQYFFSQVPFANEEKTLKELALTTTHNSDINKRVLPFHVEDNIYTHLFMVFKGTYEEILKDIYKNAADDLIVGEQKINTSDQKHIIGIAFLFSALYHDAAKWYFLKDKEVKNIGSVRSFRGHHFGGAAIVRETMLSEYWKNIFRNELNMSDVEFAAMYELTQIIVQNHQIKSINKSVLNNLTNLRISTDNFDAEQVSSAVSLFNILDGLGSFVLNKSRSYLDDPKPALQPKFDKVSDNKPLPITTKVIDSVSDAIDDIIEDINYWGFNVILMQGIPGSGKSSLSKQLQEEITRRIGKEARSVSYDAIRLEIYRKHLGDENTDSEEASAEEYRAAHEFVHNDHNRSQEMNRIAAKRIRSFLQSGKVVILDATNTNRKMRRMSLQGVGKTDKVLVVVLDVHPNDALEKNALRRTINKKEVEKDVLIRQHMWYSWPFELIDRKTVQTGRDTFLDRVVKVRILVRR